MHLSFLEVLQIFAQQFSIEFGLECVARECAKLHHGNCTYIWIVMSIILKESILLIFFVKVKVVKDQVQFSCLATIAL